MSCNASSSLLVITGGGLLGQALAKLARDSGHEVRIISSTLHESTKDSWLSSKWRKERFEPSLRGATHIFHTVAMTSVLECENNPYAAQYFNTFLTHYVASQAENNNVRMIYPSTDWVFDGTLGYYSESDSVSPINAYGKSKADGERCVLNAGGVVIRGSFIGARPDNQVGFREMLLNQKIAPVGRNRFSNPLWVGDFAEKMINVGLGEFSGILHLGSSGGINWQTLCDTAKKQLGSQATIALAAIDGVSRPRNTILKSKFPDWTGLAVTIEESIARFVLNGPLHP